MATTKTSRSRTTGTRSTTATRGTSKPRASSAKADKSLVARTGRTIKQQPYTSAAIATGAVTAVVAAAAGAFFFSRRDKSLDGTARIALTNKVKGSFADARARIKDAGQQRRGPLAAGNRRGSADAEGNRRRVRSTTCRRRRSRPARWLIEQLHRPVLERSRGARLAALPFSRRGLPALRSCRRSAGRAMPSAARNIRPSPCPTSGGCR